MLRYETKTEEMFHVKRISSGRDIKERYKTAKIDYSLIAAAIYKTIKEKGEKST